MARGAELGLLEELRAFGAVRGFFCTSALIADFVLLGASTNDALPGSFHGPVSPVSARIWWHTSHCTPDVAFSGSSASGVPGTRPDTRLCGEWHPEHHAYVASPASARASSANAR